MGKLNWSFVNRAKRNGTAPQNIPPMATVDLKDSPSER